MQSIIDQFISTLTDADVCQVAPDCIELRLPEQTGDALHVALSRAMKHCEGQFRVAAPALRVSLIVGAAHGSKSDLLTIQEVAERALTDAGPTRRLVVQDADAYLPAFETIAILQDLPHAVARQELFLLYQPKIDARERTIAGAEALIRWLHPQHGLIMPDAFIAAADESGEIGDIALWTLRQVIADQQGLAAKGQRIRLFINVSGRLLADNAFIDAACQLIHDSGAELGFEITETSVIRDPDLAIANLERCAAMGIELAIDDYGAGLSSLAYLKRLPASELKIDKQFVTQLTSSHRDPLIVRSTIDLAHALDMRVTAEGVETPAALALLTVMGCDMVQGFLISPPLKLAALATYLDEYRADALHVDAEPTILRPASFWKRGA